jgi:hypothetical protein
MTGWRRLRDWQQRGVWDLVHVVLLDWLAAVGELIGREQSWTAVPFGLVFFGRAQTGPNLTDRAKLGSKRHLICDARGVPLATQLTGASATIRKQALLLVNVRTELGGSREWGISSVALAFFPEAIPKTLENLSENILSQTLKPGGWQSCGSILLPAIDCGFLIIDYRPADSVQLGHPEDWEFTRSRCGTKFTVPRCELILQSEPSRWLSANGHPALACAMVRSILEIAATKRGHDGAVTSTTSSTIQKENSRSRESAMAQEVIDRESPKRDPQGPRETPCRKPQKRFAAGCGHEGRNYKRELAS